MLERLRCLHPTEPPERCRPGHDTGDPGLSHVRWEDGDVIHQMRELHVRREARARYGVDTALFTLSGNAILSDLRAVRALAASMTAERRATAATDPPVTAGSLNAMGLIDEILHAVVAVYREHEDPEAVDDALDHLDEVLGTAATDEVLLRFTTDFPPLAVHLGELTPEAYLAGETEGIPNREVALEELAACWLENANPAFAPYRELFDDRDLAVETAFDAVIDELRRFFADRAPFGPDQQDLITMLRAPALAEPGSLVGQLRWIRAHWGSFLATYLGERFGALMDRLVTGLDVVAEEERALWMRHHPGPGGGGTGHAPSFGGLDAEPERFSVDRDWMPRVVIMAKSTYVWLDQLSRTYGRDIRRLDQVPDEELDRLARWGFTGLWLIGLWERSRASRVIKQWRGNPDAVASAYSLRDYAIAEDLGGAPGLGHGAQPHGDRLALGRRAPRLVPGASRQPLPRLHVRRGRSLGRPAGRDPDRGPLLGFDRCRRRLPARGPLDGRGPLPLPRQ